MADRRIVQCFGIKKRPHKADKVCGRKFIWTARGASSGNFGSKGAQACPHCGTLPDFQHPYNRHLNGEMTYEEAAAAMPAYREKLGLPPI
jgi:hypothetical protein